MHQTQLEAIDARLARLERENRFLRGIGVGSLCAFALLVFGGATGQGKDGILAGEQLRLTNKAGDSRIVIGESGDGLPSLTLERTVAGRTYSMRQELFVAGDGTPILVFVDQDGTRRYKIPR